MCSRDRFSSAALMLLRALPVCDTHCMVDYYGARLGSHTPLPFAPLVRHALLSTPAQFLYWAALSGAYDLPSLNVIAEVSEVVGHLAIFAMLLALSTGWRSRRPAPLLPVLPPVVHSHAPPCLVLESDLWIPPPPPPPPCAGTYFACAPASLMACVGIGGLTEPSLCHRTQMHTWKSVGGLEEWCALASLVRNIPLAFVSCCLANWTTRVCLRVFLLGCALVALLTLPQYLNAQAPPQDPDLALLWHLRLLLRGADRLHHLRLRSCQHRLQVSYPRELVLARAHTTHARTHTHNMHSL